MTKIAACLIVGDSWDEGEVKQMLSSLEENSVDAVFINYNGTKGKLNWQKYTTLPIVYEKFEWEDDFALARQQSFSLVPRDQYDWILWIDTDDVLKFKDGETFDTLIDSLDEYTEGVFLRYAYAVDKDSGIVVVEQWRERLLSTAGEWKWQFPIHEVCKAPPGTQFARRDQCFIEHLRQTGDARGARDRNRRIIAKARAAYPDEPRFAFYFASETLAEADGTEQGPEKTALIDAAILGFQEYRMMVNEISDDVYLATSRIADLYRMKGSYSEALEADMECIAIYPDWPDGYVGGAKSCLELGQWSRMKSFAYMATKCAKPSTSASIEPMMAGFTPLFLLGIANEELGNYDEAIQNLAEAQEIWDPPEDIIGKKLAEIVEKRDTGVQPDDKSERKRLRGTKPEKSICFFTEPLPFVWHPKEDAGAGAERCVMELAPRFAADGWRTVVFGTPGQNRGEYEGVEYWRTDEYLPSEKFTVFLSSRALSPYQADVQADLKLLWMHDVNNGPGIEGYIDRIDQVIGLTKWHAAHLSKLYSVPSAKLSVVPNGVNLERFPVSAWDKQTNRLIWSSSPDRGLDVLLGMWPIMREMYSDIELHIYYGWDIIDKIIAEHRKNGRQLVGLENFRHKCLSQIEILGGEEGGIYQHGRVGQTELAAEQAKSLIWPYPTSFMETFCITAVEMQLAGVIPVASDLAALKETVAPVYNGISGWPLNRDFQQRWLSLFSATMDTNEEERGEARELARDYVSEFTWEKAYSKWNNLFTDLGVTV